MEICNKWVSQLKQGTGNPVGRPPANVDEVTSENTAISIEQGTNTTEGREVTKTTTSEVSTNTEESFAKIFSHMSAEEIEEVKDFLDENYWWFKTGFLQTWRYNLG